MSKDTIKISIPKKADYISLVRLTTSGIGYTAGLNVEDIEDIKVAIGEACVNSLILDNKEEITLIFNIYEDKLSICVTDVKENIPEQLDDNKERELGLLIIKSLMDEVIFDDKGIEMLKYIEDDGQ